MDKRFLDAAIISADQFLANLPEDDICYWDFDFTDELRGEWGFDGIVVSDYNDAIRLNILHHVEENEKMEAVSRILTVKFELGLFETVYADPDKAASIVNCDAHKALAKKAADKTMILLKNNKKLLPLDKEDIKSIAVIGPNADPVEFSYYSARPNVGTSILEGIKEKVGNDLEVNYAIGCHITNTSDVIETETDEVLRNPELCTFEEEADYIEKAVEAARKSDVAVVCIGGSPSTSREAVTLMKHYGDNAHLDFVGQQTELLKRIIETGTPTAVVIIAGKPISSEYMYDNADAVIQGWYLGQETGHSVADVLFGDVNPGAKLPVTIARTSGHLPAYYSQKPTGTLKDYIFEKEGPFFPFGFGLSYTTFAYKGLSLEKSVVKIGDEVKVSVEVTNTGDRVGDEIVQLYIRDKVASVTRPLKLLKAFKRITLEVGETKTVTFVLNKETFEFTGVDYRPVVEAGEIDIMVGSSSDTYETVVLTLE